MKAAIYDPYLDTLGGGERYMMTFASVLRDAGWSVDIEFTQKDILPKIQNRLGINTVNMRVVDSVERGDGYDLVLWLSDGSIPLLKSRNNIIHFQRPFSNVDGKSLMNRMKFYRINSVVVNSEFTKHWIDKEFPKESIVLYPPVDTKHFTSGKKENIILSVGRFSHLEQSKRQDVLVDCFKTLYDAKGSAAKKDKWKLIIAGGSDIGRTDFIDTLKKSSAGYPIEIKENPPFNDLLTLYRHAKLFWSASGFGVDETNDPNKVEHFGITVVEAMASGAVPFAYNAGGHKESIVQNVNGFVWNKKSELVRRTDDLIRNKPALREMSQNALIRSELYSEKSFKEKVFTLL